MRKLDIEIYIWEDFSFLEIEQKRKGILEASIYCKLNNGISLCIGKKEINVITLKVTCQPATISNGTNTQI